MVSLIETSEGTADEPYKNRLHARYRGDQASAAVPVVNWSLRTNRSAHETEFAMARVAAVRIGPRANAAADNGWKLRSASNCCRADFLSGEVSGWRAIFFLNKSTDAFSRILAEAQETNCRI